MWNIHVYDSQKNARYDMIIGRYLLSELQLDLCVSDYTNRVNGGAYKGRTTSTRYMNNSYVRINSDLLDAIFRDEDLWEIKHVLNAT